MVYLSRVHQFKDRPGFNPGLCVDCLHMKENRSDRGSIFLYCRKSELDPRFPKYPSLPVVRCGGYEAKPSGSAP